MAIHERKAMHGSRGQCAVGIVGQVRGVGIEGAVGTVGGARGAQQGALEWEEL